MEATRGRSARKLSVNPLCPRLNLSDNQDIVADSLCQQPTEILRNARRMKFSTTEYFPGYYQELGLRLRAY